MQVRISIWSFIFKHGRETHSVFFPPLAQHINMEHKSTEHDRILQKAIINNVYVLIKRTFTIGLISTGGLWCFPGEWQRSKRMWDHSDYNGSRNNKTIVQSCGTQTKTWTLPRPKIPHSSDSSMSNCYFFQSITLFILPSC